MVLISGAAYMLGLVPGGSWLSNVDHPEFMALLKAILPSIDWVSRPPAEH